MSLLFPIMSSIIDQIACVIELPKDYYSIVDLGDSLVDKFGADNFGASWDKYFFGSV